MLVHLFFVKKNHNFIKAYVCFFYHLKFSDPY